MTHAAVKKLLRSYSMRLLVFYASSTALVVVLCVAATFHLWQRQSQVGVNAALQVETEGRSEQQANRPSWVGPLDRAPVVASTGFTLKPVHAGWNDEQARSSTDRSGDRGAKTDSFTVEGPTGGPRAEVSCGHDWRMRCAAAHPAREDVLFQGARPAVLGTAARPDLQIVLVSCALLLLPLCGVSALLTGRALRLVRKPKHASRTDASFATRAAHELRTLLAAQRCVGELALRRESSPEQLREAVASMLEECDHIHKFIEGIHLLSQARQGRLSRANDVVCVETVLRRCVRSLQPLAEEKGQRVRLNCLSSLQVRANETLMSQAILNLIHNAIRHTPAGTSIDVSAHAARERVCIVIADNGPGFRNSDQRETDRQVRNERADRCLGLGLSIAQALVRSQGGQMLILSQPGCGTIVELKF